MTRTGLLIALSAVASFAVEAEVQRDAAAGAAATTVVRGRVTADDGGLPIRNARVSLASGSGPALILSTDADGRFAAIVECERCTVAISKPGFVARRPAPVDIGIATTIGLPRAEPTGGLDIRLLKAASISGRIVDSSGEPVSGVTVAAEPMVGPNRALMSAGAGQTDDLGEFRIGGLPAGRYTVVVNARPALAVLALNAARVALPPGYVGAITGGDGPEGTRVYYPGTIARDRAQPIELGVGEQKSPVDVALDPTMLGGLAVRSGALPAVLPERAGATGVISGRIARQDGHPLAQAVVLLQGINGNEVSWRTLTDNNGDYSFSNVPSGSYTVEASRKGSVSYEYGQRRFFEESLPVRVESGQRRERIDIGLPRLSTVAGHIVDEYGDPIDGAHVQVYRMRYLRGRRRLVEISGNTTRDTDDLGRFRIAGLEPGRYVIGAFVGGGDVQHADDLPGYSTTYWPGTIAASEAREIAVALAIDTTEVDIALARVPTSRVAGTAVTSSGQPLRGEVLLKPSEQSGAATLTPLTARVEAGGGFEFRHVPPGDYVLQAYTGWLSETAEGEFVGQFVTLAGSDVVGLLVRTAPGSTISGRIRFDAPAPRSTRDVTLQAIPVDPDLAPLNGAPARAEIRGDWTFQMSGVSGPRRLRIVEAPLGWDVQAIYLNGVDVTDTPLLFGAAAPEVRGVDVVLTAKVTEVTGSVTDAAGNPDFRCGVTIFAADRQRWYPNSRFLAYRACGRDGTFTVRRLPPGEYLIAAAPLVPGGQTGDEWMEPALLEGLASRATRVVLTEGQKISVSTKAIR